MRLEKRIRALEAKMFSDPLTLYFADGSKREIHGPRNFLLDLFVACGRGDLSPVQREQLDLIRESVDAHEPGGARMTELIRIFLHGPGEGPSSVTPVGS